MQGRCAASWGSGLHPGQGPYLSSHASTCRAGSQPEPPHLGELGCAAGRAGQRLRLPGPGGGCRPPPLQCVRAAHQPEPAQCLLLLREPAGPPLCPGELLASCQPGEGNGGAGTPRMGSHGGHHLPEHTEWPWGATGTKPRRLRPWEKGVGLVGFVGPSLPSPFSACLHFLLMKEQCQLNLC